jgi:hypothetical protein
VPTAIFVIIFTFLVSLNVNSIPANHFIPSNFALSSPVAETQNKTVKDSLHNTYGIAAGSSLTSLSPQELNTRIANMASLGVTWIRLDFDWSQIQPNNSSSYDWSTYDNIVNVISAHHINILGILDYTPAWARASVCQDTNKCYPADPNQFAAFAATVSERYSPDGLHYWEIWNEPNTPNFWAPGANAAQYTQLLKATYTSIKHVDPLSYILTGGLAPDSTTSNSYTPPDFLAAIYKDGGKGYFDGVADHPYQLIVSKSDASVGAWGQMADKTDSLRSIMVAHGNGKKKIWITEFGIPTGGPGPLATPTNLEPSSNQFEADYTVQNLVMINALALYKSYSWTGPFFWYTYQDSGTSEDTVENFFGLVDYYGNQKPTYTTYQNWITNNK